MNIFLTDVLRLTRLVLFVKLWAILQKPVLIEVKKHVKVIVTNSYSPRGERAVNTVQEEEKDNLIYVHECHSKSKNSWYETLMVTGKEVKLDSGADVSILPKYIFDSLSIKLLFNKSITTLVLTSR
uniref:Uncharacterized protein LOC114345117 n=1 Tax=Diabrotica virgifera virgifera TaxID=50390 RepID=A0A6P7GZY8_DIAVI